MSNGDEVSKEFGDLRKTYLHLAKRMSSLERDAKKAAKELKTKPNNKKCDNSIFKPRDNTNNSIYVKGAFNEKYGQPYTDNISVVNSTNNFRQSAPSFAFGLPGGPQLVEEERMRKYKKQSGLIMLAKQMELHHSTDFYDGDVSLLRTKGVITHVQQTSGLDQIIECRKCDSYCWYQCSCTCHQEALVFEGEQREINGDDEGKQAANTNHAEGKPEEGLKFLNLVVVPEESQDLEEGQVETQGPDCRVGGIGTECSKCVRECWYRCGCKCHLPSLVSYQQASANVIDVQTRNEARAPNLKRALDKQLEEDPVEKAFRHVSDFHETPAYSFGKESREISNFNKQEPSCKLDISQLANIESAEKHTRPRVKGVASFGSISKEESYYSQSLRITNDDPLAVIEEICSHALGCTSGSDEDLENSDPSLAVFCHYKDDMALSKRSRATSALILPPKSRHSKFSTNHYKEPNIPRYDYVKERIPLGVIMPEKKPKKWNVVPNGKNLGPGYYDTEKGERLIRSRTHQGVTILPEKQTFSLKKQAAVEIQDDGVESMGVDDRNNYPNYLLPGEDGKSKLVEDESEEKESVKCSDLAKGYFSSSKDDPGDKESKSQSKWGYKEGGGVAYKYDERYFEAKQQDFDAILAAEKKEKALFDASGNKDQMETNIISSNNKALAKSVVYNLEENILNTSFSSTVRRVPCALITPPTNKGLSWKNRRAISKLREEKDRHKRLGPYDVNYDLVENRITGGPSIEAQFKALAKESKRISGNPKLKLIKAELLKNLKMRGQFYGPQIHHAWCDQGKSSLSKQKLKSNEEVPQLVTETAEAFMRSQLITKKSAPVLREAPKLSKQARDKVNERIAQERTRNEWLPSQLHKPIVTDDANTVVCLEKQKGREIISVPKKGVKVVHSFISKFDMTDEIGPEFGKVVSRFDAVGPFGERPDAAVVDEPFGNFLDIQPDVNVVKKRVKSYTIPLAGMWSDVPHESRGNFQDGDDYELLEGGILELDVEMDTGVGKRVAKGHRYLSFEKQVGRFERSKTRGGVGIQDTDVEIEGGVLELELNRDITEQKPKVFKFSTLPRWEEENNMISEANHPGTTLDLDPNYFIKEERVPFVNLSRQTGRNDKEDEDSAIAKSTAMTDRLVNDRFATEVEEERQQLIKYTELNVLSNKTREKNFVNYAKDTTERFSSSRNAPQEDEIDTGMAIALERERDMAISLADQMLLSTSTKKKLTNNKNIDWSKQLDRFHTSTAASIITDEILYDKERGLKLSPKREALSRYKKPKGLVAWNKKPERFDISDTNQNNNPVGGTVLDIEIDHEKIASTTTRRGARRSTFGISMSKQKDRWEEINKRKSGNNENDALILEPRPAICMPRLKGGNISKSEGKENAYSIATTKRLQEEITEAVPNGQVLDLDPSDGTIRPRVKGGKMRKLSIPKKNENIQEKTFSSAVVFLKNTRSQPPIASESDSARSKLISEATESLRSLLENFDIREE